jgi:hypothetical protein
MKTGKRFIEEQEKCLWDVKEVIWGKIKGVHLLS